MQMPRSRREAEGLFSVFEWGNACRCVTPLIASVGAMLYVGRAHPGDFFDSGLWMSCIRSRTRAREVYAGLEISTVAPKFRSSALDFTPSRVLPRWQINDLDS